MLHGSNGDQVEDGVQGMASPRGRPIFRAEARRRYLQNQEKIALPRMISSRVFIFLWLLALLLIGVGGIVAFWPLL